MGPQFLIDSNVIIKFLVGSLPSYGASWLIEVLSYNGKPDEIKLAAVFINGSASMPIDGKVIANTIAIKRQEKIKLSDALIAGTALTHNSIIVTRNEKDFKDIDGLKTTNLHSL